MPVPDRRAREALQRACNWQHSRRHLHATEDGVFRGDNEVASKSKFETAAKRDSLDCRDGGHSQRLDRAIGQIDFRDKGGTN